MKPKIILRIHMVLCDISRKTMNIPIEIVCRLKPVQEERIQLRMSFVYTIGVRRTVCCHISISCVYLFCIHSILFFFFRIQKRVKFLIYSHLYSIFDIPIQYMQVSVMLIQPNSFSLFLLSFLCVFS